MKIENIHIDGVRSIDTLDLSLIDKNTGLPHNVILLVGENGTGKSTILDSVVCCLTIFRSSYGGNILTSEDITNGNNTASITINFILNEDESKLYNQNNKGNLSYKLINGQWYDEATSNTLTLNNLPNNNGNVMYFDAHRLIPKEKIKGPNNDFDNPKYFNDRSLMPSFIQTMQNRFQHTKQWLVNIDYKEAKLYRSDQEDSELLNNVMEAFNMLYEPYSFSKISYKSEILFNTPHGEVEISYLSDGMKSIFSILGDILFRFSLPYIDQDEIDINEMLNTEAIILIDEIECHLHPKWQLRIIPALRKLFPNAQFIITTHSPLIVKSVRPDEIVILGGGIIDSE